MRDVERRARRAQLHADIDRIDAGQRHLDKDGRGEQMRDSTAALRKDLQRRLEELDREIASEAGRDEA